MEELFLPYFYLFMRLNGSTENKCRVPSVMVPSIHKYSRPHSVDHKLRGEGD